jgi:SAM-dependent methyltransferase
MKTTLKWRVAQGRELSWWQGYLKKKDKDGYLHWKKNYWYGILDPIKKDIILNVEDDVLDAGCGPAGVFIVLDRYKVDAVDPLIDQYEEKLTHFKKSYYPKVNFFSVPLEQYNTDKNYQCIFCMNAINHVADLTAAFDKLISVTKNKGYVIISIDAHNHNSFKKLFRLIPADVLHPHQYDLKEYEDMLTTRNCSIVVSKLLKHEFFFNHYLLVARRN